MSDLIDPAQPSELNPKFIGAIDAIRRTGAVEVQVRYSDDQEPLAWLVIAGHLRDARGLPVGRNREPAVPVWMVGGGLSATEAAVRCAEQIVDGGQCAHCGRPTALDADGDLNLPGFCMMFWDPASATFKQQCE